MDKLKYKVVRKLTSQKETLKMAAYFSKRDLSITEKVFGIIGSIIFYGVSFGFLIYMIILAIML